MPEFDATVVGAGPNGLAAALELARSGRKVLVVEAGTTIGGGTRTSELTLPGFRHDVCSAVHPFGIASPFFNEVVLDIDWIQPDIPVTQPLDDGSSAVLYRSLEETASALGSDGGRYRSMMRPFTEDLEAAIELILGPMRVPGSDPRRLARIATRGGIPASLQGRRFSTPQARALFAGLAAHSLAPFHRLATTGVGVALGAVGHVLGWPIPRGGSATIAEALASEITKLGGVIETGRRANDLADLPGSQIFLNLMPRAVLEIGHQRLSASSKRRLEKWRPGSGVFKIDWALDGPVPWTDPASRRAGTVHVGGTFEEVAKAELAVAKGDHPERPFVLVAQQSLFDDSRAPEGKHTLWGYCHVPNGSQVDMTARIEAQIERFAPGFKELILGRHTTSSVEYEEYNPNLVGGDIGGGRFGPGKVLQLGRRRPYQLGPDLFLCSSAVPPGAGVHGMAGFNAVRAALD